MNKIDHQFLGQVPSWEVKHLFVGTFNPASGEKVKYFYGRKRNQFWKILSQLFKEDFNTEREDFFEKVKKHKIACIDLIETVESDRVISSYADSKIINSKTKRKYNTENISAFIQNSPNIKVYSTWGNGSSYLEWKNEISKIDTMINLVSPSLAAKVDKGVKKFDYMLENWRKQILQ